MKLWLLRTLDTIVHFVLYPLPFPAWAYRVCQAYMREVRRGDDNR
jgi:hypothetical protein